MKELARYKSNHNEYEDHVITTDDDNRLTCSCKAAKYGKICWAMRKYDQDQFQKEYEAALRKENKIKIPDKETLIREQTNYVYANWKQDDNCSKIWSDRRYNGTVVFS